MNQASICVAEPSEDTPQNKAALSLVAACGCALELFDNPTTMLYTYLLRLRFRIQ